VVKLGVVPQPFDHQYVAFMHILSVAQRAFNRGLFLVLTGEAAAEHEPTVGPLDSPPVDEVLAVATVNPDFAAPR
jgi:hypothetical protein